MEAVNTILHPVQELKFPIYDERVFFCDEPIFEAWIGVGIPSASPATHRLRQVKEGL